MLVAAGTLIACMGAGCSSEPVSRATSFAAPSTPGPGASSSSGASIQPSIPATPPAAPAGASPDVSPGATPAAIGDAPPPNPGHPTFRLVSSTSGAGSTTVTYEIGWTSPEGVASRFLAYGLTVCLRDSARYDTKPCIVRHMKVPANKLDLLGEAPGDARSLTVSWQDPVTGPPTYWSVLLRATNANGDSIFTIVHTENVCHGCVY